MMKTADFMSYFDNDLLEVKKIIKGTLKERDSKVSDLINRLALTDGKMIRALLVLIGGSFGEKEKNSLLHLSAGIEILHLATLVHDDIVDESDLRRGKITLNASHGTKAALFMGDYLFCKSYVLFSKYSSPEGITYVSETIKTICSGEICQFLTTYSLNSSIRDYLKRINGKCASLFSLSLSIGVYEGTGNEKILLNLKRIGYYCGMAFQLMDDILDITTEKSSALGKPTESDIKKGIYSLPILYELKNNNNALITSLQNDDLEKTIEILKASEGLKKSKEVAKKYTLKALALIDELPDRKEKFMLRKIVEFLLNRTY